VLLTKTILAGDTVFGRGHVDAIIKLIFGVKRYDYILKFKRSDDDRTLELRASFEKKLLKKGLLVERETSIEEPSETFLKIVTPFNVLCNEAQITKLKIPLKVNEVSIQIFFD
jgi:hypothetical protein